jgi:hypothetical protein
MALSAPKRKQIEAYWTQYFLNLDKLAPHDQNSRAADFDVARELTCYACKDGTLCWFDKGSTLKIQHRSSGITVEVMFNNLSAPVRLNFEGGFPDAHDFGPVGFNKVASGETTTVPVFFYRAVWGRGTVLGTSESPESQAIQDHQPEKGNRRIAIGPTGESKSTRH